MKQTSHQTTGFYTVIAAGIIFAVFFLLILSGTSTYRRIVARQEKNNRDRILLSYVLANVKSGDVDGAVRIYTENDTPVVAVEEGDSGYGIRIYQHEGKLMGDYGKLDQALNPKDALAIGETETFRVEDLGNKTYRVTTDAGSAFFHIKSKMD